MGPIDITKDFANATMVVTTEFDHPLEQVWQLWADPRKLERWWGPPTYPATVTEHDLRPGGSVRYHMTGPEGDSFPGGWAVLAVAEPHSLDVEDVFLNDDGTVNRNLPVSRMEVRLVATATDGTAMTVTSRYASADAMQQVIDMGVEQGLRGAMSQIEAILAG
jgi:uncharacterized protein YndB with AHSA1/START domain